MWQEIVVFACVGLAGIFVLKRYWPGRLSGSQRSGVDSSPRLPVANEPVSTCGTCRACSGGGCH